MFELDVPTKATVTKVDTLNQKNKKPGEAAGSKIVFDGIVSNDVLSTIEGHIKGALYQKANGKSAETQGSLEGVAPVSDMPDLTRFGQQCGMIKVETEMTGYQLVIDQGLGGLSDIDENGCLVSELRIWPKRGGSVRVKFAVTCPNVADSQWPKLARMKGREVELALFAPKVDQREIEGASDPKH